MSNNFLSGIKSSIPVCLGVIPVGISIGLLAVQAGLLKTEAVLMSAMVMAGSAQLMAINMLSQGTGFFTIILGTFFINLRHIVMSSSVMKGLKNKTTMRQRMIGAFALCDESFAIYSLSDDGSYAFLLGSNFALYASFVGSTIAGTFMTSYLPQIVADSFGVAFYAAFLGLLLPNIKGKGRLILLVLITAVLNGFFSCFLHSSWSVILSMISGAFIGIFLVNDDPDNEMR